ncbi:MAG: DNA translocase FtsK [Chloroherpetonaceae bacterium]|nr:DNA translocase FtsK [Chthonomonadaceae bacterium]MDW8208463.1 DNA translocase FtsK [Chloroherpetonaceae bacterium]
MVKVPRTRGAEAQRPSRLSQDITGLLLFFTGAAGLISLTWKQEGLLPGPTAFLLRSVAGDGAFVIPLMLMFVGTMFLIGYERFSFSRSTIGTIILFLAFVAWRHLVRFPTNQVWHHEDVQQAGGWLGALLGSALTTLGGTTISYLFLLTMVAVALVMMTDQPLLVLLQHCYRQGRAGASAAGRGVKAGARLLPSGRKTAQDPHAPLRWEKKPGREERVQQGTGSAGADAETPVALDVEAGDGRSTTGKLLRIFHFAQSRRPDEGQSGATDEPGQDTDPDAAEIPIVSGASDVPAREGQLLLALSGEREEVADPEGDRAEGFVLPPLSLLREAPVAVARRTQAELKENIQKIEQTLQQFNIGANVVEVASGPSVTRYEIQLAPGIKVNKIVSLADNLAMSLAAIDVRVEAPIPGKSAIGVEVPNATPVTVSLRECLDTEEFRNAPSKLTFALGKDVAGQYRYADLARMPHLLIGGSTNSGKSVCLNVIIASLIYRATPREVRLLMIDPKRVELSLWDGIPHLMHPVVKDVKQASGIFRAALREMDRRYDLFAAMGTRNIDGYNQRVLPPERLPYLVLIVDELADLMMQQGAEIENSICRLAQLARATGIHLVIATQRPSVDIITGTIKANIASRIAFAVASQVDSRTILDMTGAERLIGRGDMLFMPIDAAKPLRIQGCYLSEQETLALVEYLKTQGQPEYAFTLSDSEPAEGSGSRTEEEVDDALFERAVRLVVNNGQASTSMLQRRFRIGYARAARIVEMMEERGIVGPLNGAKPREILVSKDEVERLFRPSLFPEVSEGNRS